MGSVDKRLAIELASLRQFLWRESGKAKPDRSLIVDLPTVCTDVFRWVDMSVMVADGLTKLMREDYMLRVPDSFFWNAAQTAEARSVT